MNLLKLQSAFLQIGSNVKKHLYWYILAGFQTWERERQREAVCIKEEGKKKPDAKTNQAEEKIEVILQA